MNRDLMLYVVTVVAVAGIAIGGFSIHFGVVDWRIKEVVKMECLK